jgi:hypothetical protein
MEWLKCLASPMPSVQPPVPQIPNSLFERFSIAKLPVLFKVIYRFTAIQIKISAGSFCILLYVNSKMNMEMQKTCNNQDNTGKRTTKMENLCC